MPDTNTHGRSGSGRPPWSPAWAARPIRHETHLAVCVHPTPARDPTSAKGRRREAGHLANPDVTLDAGRRSWSKEPDVDRSKRPDGCRNPFPHARCPRRLVTHIAPRRPGSLPWRKPHRSPGDARYGPGRPAPPSAGRGQRMRVRRMTGRLSCGTPRPRGRHRPRGCARLPLMASATHSDRCPCARGLTHGALLSGTSLRDDLRPCVSVPANAHHRGRRSRGALWRRADACANARRQSRRAHAAHSRRAGLGAERRRHASADTCRRRSHGMSTKHHSGSGHLSPGRC